jgi:hypothetical protein
MSHPRRLELRLTLQREVSQLERQQSFPRKVGQLVKVSGSARPSVQPQVPQELLQCLPQAATSRVQTAANPSEATSELVLV